MKKTIITLATVALAASAGQARSLSPAEALGRALDSSDAPAAVGAMRAPGRVLPQLTLNIQDSDAPALYVISRGENQGFVVVSADDAVAPLLGYSDEAVDFDNLPDNFKWWLSQYQAEITAAVNAGADLYEAPAADNKAAIEPMVTTRWDQDAPYNDLCPKVGNTRCPSGCVATAMAQVINYHKYPEKGIGTHSYSWNGQTLSFDYGNTTFQWDKMLDRYSYNSGTAEQRKAVATLMYACGVSVDMGYKAESSGAMSATVPFAMREFFGFDKAVHFENRCVYTSQQWIDKVYEQLEKVGPVYYSGRGESGGHAFVCDGYKDGLFHFNWGWGGMSDGYFRLNELVPGSQGIGGNSDGFNTDQGIIVGAQKPVDGSELAAPYVMCSTLLNPTVVGNYLTLQNSFSNYTPYRLTCRLGLELRDAETGEFVRNLTSSSVTMETNQYVSKVQLSLFTMPQGHYHAYPVVIVDGVSTPIHLFAWNKGYIDITKSGNKVTAENVQTGAITWGEAEMLSPFYTNKLFAVNLPYEFTAESDILLPVIPYLMEPSGATAAVGERFNAIVTPGSGVVEYAGTWITQYSTLKAGSYKLEFRTPAASGDALIAGPYDIEMKTINNVSLLRVNDDAWSIADSEAVPMDNVVINAKVSCVLGYYAGAVTAKIYEKGDKYNPLTAFNSNNIFISNGENVEVVLNGDLLNGVPGKTYDIYLYNGMSILTVNPKSFVLGNESGIDSVIAEDEAPVTYYNLQGQPVENPVPGTVVIRRQGDKVSKILVK